MTLDKNCEYDNIACDKINNSHVIWLHGVVMTA